MHAQGHEPGNPAFASLYIGESCEGFLHVH